MAFEASCVEPAAGHSTVRNDGGASDHDSLDELGYPSRATANGRLLRPIDTPDLPIELYSNLAEPPDFDPNLQRHVAWWLAEEAERILAVYGEWDPWTYGAYEPSAEVTVLTVPEGDHGVGIIDVPLKDFDMAFSLLEDWTGVEPRGPSFLLPRRVAPDLADGLKPPWAFVDPTTRAGEGGQ